MHSIQSTLIKGSDSIEFYFLIQTNITENLLLAEPIFIVSLSFKVN